jgi:hypothetical protein
MQVSSSVQDMLLMEIAACESNVEQMGFRVGQSLVEKATINKPRFIDTLDIIKFICKDFWILAFTKQIDNLRTNHKVLIANDRGRICSRTIISDGYLK